MAALSTTTASAGFMKTFFHSVELKTCLDIRWVGKGTVASDYKILFVTIHGPMIYTAPYVGNMYDGGKSITRAIGSVGP